MDQKRVRSGFDVEIALGERYLQYLLLLAVDVGAIPVEIAFADPPIKARLQVPPDLDRTYPLIPTLRNRNRLQGTLTPRGIGPSRPPTGRGPPSQCGGSL